MDLRVILIMMPEHEKDAHVASNPSNDSFNVVHVHFKVARSELACNLTHVLTTFV
jgi:hypothetical protein